MLDEEILFKYRAKIDDSIAKLIAEYGLTDDSAIAELTAKYKQNFVKGFKEGIEIGKARGQANLREEKLKIAQEMLKRNIDINLISQITNLSLDQIKDIKNSK